MKIELYFLRTFILSLKTSISEYLGLMNCLETMYVKCSQRNSQRNGESATLIKTLFSLPVTLTGFISIMCSPLCKDTRQE